IFDEIVVLAEIELNEEEAEKIRSELNNQLTAIEELSKIEIPSGTLPAAHGVAYTPQISQKIREDKHKPFANPEDILAQAPDTEEGYFVVPPIPHEDLD
ncbi:MAG: Asp-tRNA(Asn)/Glu-tRNA(Gln) amidotransferase subunit GatC, partial [Chloroflexota bacterium]